jgi:hypothetical protein
MLTPPGVSVIPNTYTNLSKGIRTAQALYEAGYNDQYVLDALYKKGYDHKQSIWMMHSAEVENVSQRAKTSRLGVLIFGGAWVVIFTIIFFANDNPESTAHLQRTVIIPGRYWIIAAVVFLGSVGNWWYAARQLARVKKNVPPHPAESGSVTAA